MAPLKIGVLGGIGPEATGNFYLKLIKKLQSEGLVRKNQDFPQIFINSIPAPELIFNKLDKVEVEPYLQGLRELDSIHPDFIVIVCNTIHLFHKELQSKIKSPLIDLRKEVEQEIKRLKIKNITVMGTPSTISLGLYNFKGVNYLNPNKEEMEILSATVFNFNQGIDRGAQKNKVEQIAKKYLLLGSERVVLGCTELAVMLEKMDAPRLNTIDVLVDAVVRKCKENTNSEKNKIYPTPPIPHTSGPLPIPS